MPLESGPNFPNDVSGPGPVVARILGYVVHGPLFVEGLEACPHCGGAVLACHCCVVADHDCLLRAARGHDVEQLLACGEPGRLGEAGDDPAVGAPD
eukprot:13994622-Heterocapsa_arctica.AAC.2